MSVCRSFKISTLAAVALLAGSLCASAQEQRFIWGVNGHPLVSYPGVSIEEQLDAVHDLGLTSYRVDLQGEDQAGGLAELVAEGKKRGIEILPAVTPRFDLDKETPEALRKQSYDLAFALVSRFKGDIKVWELGNELENYAILRRCESHDSGMPRLCIFGDASGNSPSDYSKARWAKASAVLKGLTEGAHAADPSVRRAIGTAGWGHVGAFQLMKADGIDWDISIWHMYGEDPEWAFKELSQYEKPIWVTEYNNPRGSENGKEEQVKGLIKTMTRLSELEKVYEVEAAHIYELMDEPYWGEGYESVMGLIEMQKDGAGGWKMGDRKPAFVAVKDYLDSIGARPAQPIVVARNCELKPPVHAGEPAMSEALSYAYCLTLGRAPDGSGLAGWVTRLKSDMSMSEVVIALMDNAEFEDRNDVAHLSAREYVSLVYRYLLGREPSAEAAQQAAADLGAGKPHAELIAALVNGKDFRNLHPVLFGKLADTAQAAAETEPKPVSAVPEVTRRCDTNVLSRPLQFERGQVNYAYCLVLGRWPDGYGMGTWIGDLREGRTLKSFLLALLQSAEFEDKYKTGKLDNGAFVTFVYRLLLDRDPDAAGLQLYVSQLDEGALSRVQVFEEILDSSEFHTKQEALFSALKVERRRAELETH
jgi:Domain of unknown function (DUF4214)/Glycosyl hydrolase catalytic core